MVILTHRYELHPDSLFAFRPPHDSLRSYCGQLGRPAEDQVKVAADGEHHLWKEAEPRAAHVLSLLDVVGHPFQHGDTQGRDEARSAFLFLYYCGHGFSTFIPK